MTEAIRDTQLGKLDLFTPSPLHPDLPPLTSATYYLHATMTCMLSQPEVLARLAHVESLLGAKADDVAVMRGRAAAHERIINHWDIYYSGRGVWSHNQFRPDPSAKTKSLRTVAGMKAYATKGMKREREALGLEPVDDVLALLKRPRQA